MSSTPLHDACKKDKVSLDEILELLNDGPDDVMKKDHNGRLPIHRACFKGQSFEVIDALIKAYPDGLKVQDNDGWLPIHEACANGQSFEVIDALIKAYPDGLKVRDGDGRMPIHVACARGHDEQGFDVIEALINKYPEALGKHDSDGRTPFEWDYKESCGGYFKEFVQHLFPARGADAENEEEKDRRHKRILTHCKNYVPVDILRIGFLDEKTLKSHSFTEWLNGMLCRRSVVFMMVLELYLHMAWIYTFVSASYRYFVESDEPLGWRPTALLVFAAMFLLEETSQFIRLHVTGELLHYCTNWWNWIDVATCVMVIVSAVRFLDEDSSIDGRLLMTTGCLQSLLLLSYLKKTFFPFSKFVSGVIKIIWGVFPFLVVSAVTLFTFSFMYFVQDQDELKNRDVVLVFNNTNNSNLEDDASSASLMLSFQTVFEKFAGGAKESLSALDFFFGIIVVIVLLNVIIAVVSGKWDEAEAEANASFWKYRLDLIIEKTRGLSLGTSYYNEIATSARIAGLPIPDILNSAEWRWDHNHRDTWGGHVDEIFIDPETVGTTMEEFKMKLAVKNKEAGMFACIKLLMECFVFFVLGFPTFGLLWPQFIRQILFTPSKPKESSDAVSERKRETFEREIANEVSKLSKKVVDQNELLAEYKKDQNESLAEYKKTVSELSQKVSAQNDLLEQLLKKVS